RFGVDHFLRHQAFAFGDGETLFHRTLNTHETDTELVFGQFADRTHAAVAEVVDVVDFAFTVLKVDQDLHRVDDVFFGQNARTFVLAATDATVELHATDG